MKKRYTVKGMSCAACVAHVERSAERICKKENISVSLLTNSLTVTLDEGVDEEKIYLSLKKELKKAGYTLEREEKRGEQADSEYKKGIKRLVASAIITVVLMTVAMGHMIGIPMPRLFAEHPYLFALLQLALTVPIIVIITSPGYTVYLFSC
jgi:Cu+-exporting ATPase